MINLKNNNLTKEDIITSLEPLNGKFFEIENLQNYGEKVLKHGNNLSYVDENGKVISYVIYYENEKEIFITMVWTIETHHRMGLAKKLLKKIFKKTDKDIRLSVHEDNNARFLYKKLNFTEESIDNRIITMKLKK